MTVRILQGDCRDVLATLPDNSVHCVVTSPPYYGLRDYGTALWEGGNPDCDHTGIRRNHGGEKQATSAGTSRDPVSRSCLRCGARRIDRQIGLEKTPDEYLATMVAVFREVRRVMRNDAVAFINMGDGYRDKQLLLMPARLALALQAEGWWVRSDIIWHKPNPMPESCTDRPTSAHEHVFLLTKSARYFYDADAVREEAEYGRREWSDVDGNLRRAGGNPRDLPSATVSGSNPSSGRNLRNVWTIATSPFPDAHFATFPPELAERCIRAGTSERGACSQCGKPWHRVVERQVTRPGVTGGATPYDSNRPDGMTLRAGGFGDGTITTTGWQPGCDHGAEVVPCTVLDPFCGAATSLLVAQRLRRDAIGIELNPEYVRMSQERIERDAGMFSDIAVTPVPVPVPVPTPDTEIADLFAESAAPLTPPH